MQLDYLLQEGYKGYIKISNNEENIYIQDYLLTCGYKWGGGLRVHSVNTLLIIFVPYRLTHLSYDDKVPLSHVTIRYIDITQEVYQLAGLLPTPYEYW